MAAREATPIGVQVTQRLLPLDALRGLLVALMALDHASYFVAQRHSSGEHWGGPFPTYTDAFPFLTRLITHLCAPGFFFLMGVGMLLFARSRAQRRWGRPAITWHFLLRGILLIALQFLVENRAWEISAGGWSVDVYVGVLFALGGCMILGSLCLWLKPTHLAVLTLVLFVGSELMIPSLAQWRGLGPLDLPGTLARLLFYSGGDGRLWVNYPVLPWLELVTLGMLCGHWLLKDPRQAMTDAARLGGLFLLAFVIVRGVDGFGNLRPRSGADWIAFLNVVKYPPSWAYTLLTMGVNLLLLWLLGRLMARRPHLLQPLIVLGQAPLFFYVVHLFLYAVMGRLVAPHGMSLIWAYPYWLLGLLLLFPLCLWYNRIRRQQRANSLLRLL